MKNVVISRVFGNMISSRLIREISGRERRRCKLVPKVRTSRGLRGHDPWEIFEIGLSVTPFPAFPGREVVNREGPLRHHSHAAKSDLSCCSVHWSGYENVQHSGDAWIKVFTCAAQCVLTKGPTSFLP